MKIGIYGAGVIGCYLGGRLASIGFEVTFLCRPRMFELLQQRGMTLSDYRGADQHVSASALKLTTSPQDLSSLDMIFICVKSAATETVAHELKRRLDARRPILISFQNGMSNVPLLRSILTEHSILEGMVPFNVSSPQQGHFHQGTDGALVVKSFEGQFELQRAFEDAGLEIQFSTDMLSIQWAKVLLNLNNPINALSGLPLKQQLSIRAYRQCLAMAQTEALGLLQAADIQPAKLTVLPASLIPHVLTLPNLLFKALSRKMLKTDPLARSSMQDDLNAGRTTEIDWINGEVVRLADRLGCAAPINTCLVRLIKQAEQNTFYQPMGADELKTALSKYL